jgi:polyhydroxybutyrate depolymerase
MKRLLLALRLIAYGLAGITVFSAALFRYFVYTPDPGMPPLSGTLTRGSMDVGALSRTYVTYRPSGTSKDLPVVLVMHGAGEALPACGLKLDMDSNVLRTTGTS